MSRVSNSDVAPNRSLSRLVARGLCELRTNPAGLYAYAKAFAKGLAFAAHCRLFKPQVRIELPFFIYCGRIRISGPGAVEIGKGCSVFANAFDRLSIVTATRDSRVTIGKGCDLGGVTIRCHDRVSIGEYCLFASCLIQDRLFMSDSRRRGNAPGLAMDESSGIRIGSRVWLAGLTVILGGASVGDGAVVSVGSVLWNHGVAENHLAFGNPVRRSASIGRIEQFLAGR